MILISTFLRCSFSVQALGQSSLTIFMLSSALCLLVSSYIIDDSCKHYKGEDITADIERAINEVKEMADNAHNNIIQERSISQPRIKHMLDIFFGDDHSRHSPRHNSVVDLFEKVAALSPTTDFAVICDDQDVQLVPDTFSEIPDPRGVWRHLRYRWLARYDQYTPCDPARKPQGLLNDAMFAYTLLGRLIYLCPHALDNDLGRSLAPYKDLNLAGSYIEDYQCTPVVLFHELLHTDTFTRTFDTFDAEVRDYPPTEDFENPNINVYDPSYISSLPMELAYGFIFCQKLAIDSPDLAARNCDSIAFCALGLYLHMNDWGVPSKEGFATPL